MKKKKFLTRKEITLLKEERANKIVSSFKDTFKKIKRVEESFEEDLTEEELDEGIPLTGVGGKEGQTEPQKRIPLTRVGGKEGDATPNRVPLKPKVSEDDNSEELKM